MNGLLKMYADEYKFIMRYHNITYEQLGKNAPKILGREKPYTPATIHNWVRNNDKLMKLYQIELLRCSIPNDIFEQIREEYRKRLKHWVKVGFISQKQADKYSFKDEEV